MKVLRTAFLLAAAIVCAALLALLAMLVISLALIFTCDPMMADALRPAVCSYLRPWDEIWLDDLQGGVLLGSFAVCLAWFVFRLLRKR